MILPRGLPRAPAMDSRQKSSPHPPRPWTAHQAEEDATAHRATVLETLCEGSELSDRRGCSPGLFSVRSDLPARLWGSGMAEEYRLRETPSPGAHVNGDNTGQLSPAHYGHPQHPGPETPAHAHRLTGETSNFRNLPFPSEKNKNSFGPRQTHLKMQDIHGRGGHLALFQPHCLLLVSNRVSGPTSRLQRCLSPCLI